jgi:hypothetical protein
VNYRALEKNNSKHMKKKSIGMQTTMKGTMNRKECRCKLNA